MLPKTSSLRSEDLPEVTPHTPISHISTDASSAIAKRRLDRLASEEIV